MAQVLFCSVRFAQRAAVPGGQPWPARAIPAPAKILASETVLTDIYHEMHLVEARNMTILSDRLSARGFVLLALIVVLTRTAAADVTQDLEANVDAFMAKLMENLDVVPGYSVVVATANATVFAKGYGSTAEPDGQPMDADTQTYIASSTKSMTGLAVASLAERGLIDLDVRIDKLVPDLAGSNAGRVTMRQLLAHTHGLVEEALTWRTAYSGQYTEEVLLNLVKQMPVSSNPGEFSYSNTGYVIASLVLEHCFDKSWKEIVAEEVLRPVGMTSTTAFVSALKPGYAEPHSWYGVKNHFSLTKRDSTMHAAGGHFSTANDMGLWLQAQLSDGKIQGRKVYPAGLVSSTHAPIVALDKEFFVYKRHHYGIGWYQADYNGHLMYHHFGSYSGYRSHVSFIPELGVGVAVLINDTSRPGIYLPDMVANYIYDLVAGSESPGAAPKRIVADLAEMIKPLAGRAPPERPRKAPEDEDRYAGSYFNEDFGTIQFAMVEGELVATFGNLRSRTTYKDDGSIRMELSPYEGTLGEFLEDKHGKITGFQYRGATYRR